MPPAEPSYLSCKFESQKHHMCIEWYIRAHCRFFRNIRVGFFFQLVNIFTLHSKGCFQQAGFIDLLIRPGRSMKQHGRSSMGTLLLLKAMHCFIYLKHLITCSFFLFVSFCTTNSVVKSIFGNFSFFHNFPVYLSASNLCN